VFSTSKSTLNLSRIKISSKYSTKCFSSLEYLSLASNHFQFSFRFGSKQDNPLIKPPRKDGKVLPKISISSENNFSSESLFPMKNLPLLLLALCKTTKKESTQIKTDRVSFNETFLTERTERPAQNNFSFFQFDTMKQCGCVGQTGLQSKRKPVVVD
jgi:hypothetical protein